MSADPQTGVMAGIMADLKRAKYISLTTFRLTGAPVVTPVWFALDADGTIYVESAANAGKVKRIRHTPRVTVATCTINGKLTGPTIESTAHVLTDEQERAYAVASIARKYGLPRRLYYSLLDYARVVRRKPKDRGDYLAITIGEFQAIQV